MYLDNIFSSRNVNIKRLKPTDKPSHKNDSTKTISSSILIKKKTSTTQPAPKKKLQKTTHKSSKPSKSTTHLPSEVSLANPLKEQKTPQDSFPTLPHQITDLELDPSLTDPTSPQTSKEYPLAEDDLEETPPQHVEDGDELYYDLNLTHHQFSPSRAPQADEERGPSQNLQDTVMFRLYSPVSPS